MHNRPGPADPVAPAIARSPSQLRDFDPRSAAGLRPFSSHRLSSGNCSGRGLQRQMCSGGSREPAVAIEVNRLPQF